MRKSISTLPVFSSFMKLCVARTFRVELHLDVVLEDFFFTKLVDIYQDDCFINGGDI